jgi:flagellar M-ring protein FliF
MMNELIKNSKEKFIALWSSFPTKKKILIAGSFLLSVIVLFLLTYAFTKSEFVPIYSDLLPNEAGEIKQAIEAKGVAVQISSDGSIIYVPKSEAASLKVNLAAEGIPKSGSVDYGIFSENMGLGMTDRHFDVVERDAMQSEIAYLVEQIVGIHTAKVMITLPKESIWLNDDQQTATASIVLTLDPGTRIDQAKINGLYHLVSKSVPNLPAEEIVIMDQYGQIFEQGDQRNGDPTLTAHQQQREIRRDIEKDIQRQVQQLLGTILGQDKVVVSVFASVDFTKERSTENLIRPADQENNEGVTVSVERIVESYTGNGNQSGGTAGTGEDDVPNYEGVDNSSGSGDFEKLEERINQEYDRIYREIEKSPYILDDLTINIGVEPPNASEPESLTSQNIEDIKSILRNVVRTSLSESNQTLDDDTVEKKISVFATEFKGKPNYGGSPGTGAMFGVSSGMLTGIGIALAVIIIGGVVFFMMRRKKQEEMAMYDAQSYAPVASDLDLQSLQQEQDQEKINEERKTQANVREEVEAVAQEQPQEFVKVLKTWLREEDGDDS